MRDAFGGAFSIQVMLVFLVLYVSFICVALNYARAFRVKNRIINIIEQYEESGEELSSGTQKKINTYLESRGYKPDCKGSMKDTTMKCNDNNTFSYKKISEDKRWYYKVETYMNFDLYGPIRVNFAIPIRGETRLIESINV